MASSKDYLTYVLDQLSGLDGVACKPMMGEYILYYQGKIFGGVYDDRLLVKPTKTAKAMLPRRLCRPLPHPPRQRGRHPRRRQSLCWTRVSASRC